MPMKKMLKFQRRSESLSEGLQASVNKSLHLLVNKSLQILRLTHVLRMKLKIVFLDFFI